ncbi:hypothetical protein [Anaeroselena agilis]|uniref:Uncharacterized protein n=1 Tax=Anaeroselena agilis TaxID=3063788 RepID=A0ABU3NYW0_9FIRM|nr:hypothetical protein [Selenomonadales bacterium 4137-cl]
MFGKWFTSFDLFTQIILARQVVKSKQLFPQESRADFSPLEKKRDDLTGSRIWAEKPG